MSMVDDIAGLRRILAQTRTIAVVGLSANWYRPSYFAAKYMQDHGYRIIPVNPAYDEVLGERCYPTIAAIPEAVDMVDCFRKPGEIALAGARGRGQGSKDIVDAAWHPQRRSGTDRQRCRVSPS